MFAKKIILLSFITVFLLLNGCSGNLSNSEVIKSIDIDGSTEFISQDLIEFDNDISNDGNGSIKISALEPTVINLLEFDDIDIENAILVYRAKLKTENLLGKAYLEMYCVFEGTGEFFSRGLDQTVSGTSEWTTKQTPFILKTGQNPDSVKLNLVIDGSGTVWIDEIALLKKPL
ncbi:MAG TPA: hypothetical protein PLN69_03190 [bacterium]|nr:hypothetical protein [bacterium]